MIKKLQRFVSQPSEGRGWEVAVYNEQQQNYVPIKGELYPMEELAKERATQLNKDYKEKGGKK